jgi:hypothetical protein
LARKIGLDYIKIFDINFKGIVLSKNSIGSHSVNMDNGIPIISEDLLWLILKEPHNKDIITLYDVAKNKKYYPLINKHFSIQSREVEYAGYKFVEKGCYVPDKSSWNPKYDICI